MTPAWFDLHSRFHRSSSPDPSSIPQNPFLPALMKFIPYGSSVPLKDIPKILPSTKKNVSVKLSNSSLNSTNSNHQFSPPTAISSRHLYNFISKRICLLCLRGFTTTLTIFGKAIYLHNNCTFPIQHHSRGTSPLPKLTLLPFWAAVLIPILSCWIYLHSTKIT